MHYSLYGLDDAHITATARARTTMLTIGRSPENVVHWPSATELRPLDSIETARLDWIDIFRPLHTVSDDAN